MFATSVTEGLAEGIIDETGFAVLILSELCTFCFLGQSDASRRSRH